MQFFLPEKLNPQGWLNDMLLSQLYNEGGDDSSIAKLRKALYEENYAGIREKLISFHPAHRDTFTETMTAKSSDATKYDPKLKMKYVDFMKNIQPYQVAAMQPYIRIFFKSKQVHAPGASWKNAIEKDIIFRTYTDITDLAAAQEGVLQNKFMRGSEAGIEKVSVVRDFPVWGMGASFYFEVDYIFSSFKIFAEGHPVIKRGSEKPIYDATGRLVRDGRHSAAKDYFILLTPDLQHEFECLNLEYGWKINNKKDTSFWGVPSDVLDTVEAEEKKSFKISWYKHDIKYSETGEVRLNVKYMGLPEKLAFENPSANRETNILAPLSMDVLKSTTKQKDLVAGIENLKEAKKRLEKLNQEFQATIDDKKSKKEQKKQKKALGIDKRQEEIRRASVWLNKEKQRLASRASSLYVKRILKRGKLFQVRFKSSRDSVPDAAKYKAKKHKLKVSFYKVLGTDIRDKNAKKGMQSAELKEYTKKASIVEFSNSYGVDESLQKTKNNVKPNKTITNPDDHCLARLDEVLGALTYSNFGTAAEKDAKKYVVTPGKKCPSGYKPVGKSKTGSKKGKLRCVSVARPSKGEGRGGRPETYGNFMFFPLRDLIAVMYEFSKSDDPRYNPYDRIPITSLGNIVYRPMGKDVTINIGDILVEVGVFQKWLYNKILKHDSGTITFGQFITSIMEELVPIVLGHSASQLSSGMLSSIVHTPLLISHLFHGSSIGGFEGGANLDNLYLLDPWSSHAGEIGKGLEDMSKYQAETKSNKKNDIPIIHFHQRVIPSMAGDKWKTPHTRLVAHRDMKDRAGDEKDGLFYLHIGEASGLLETINFSYTDNPKLRTALVYDKYKDVSYPYLKYAYSATPSLVGNNLFYKGGFFVLPESPLGIKVKDDPGITGYYQISKLTDEIGPGTYKTTVQGLNVWSGPDQRRHKKREASGKLKVPEPIPISLQASIDEYVYKDFLVNSALVLAYELAIKSEEEADESPDAPVADKISLGDPPKNLKVGEGVPPNPPSERVKKLQKKLGMTGKDANGQFGSKTKAAVEKYQKDKGLKPANGVVDKKTLGVLQAPPKPPPIKTTTKKDIEAIKQS